MACHSLKIKKMKILDLKTKTKLQRDQISRCARFCLAENCYTCIFRLADECTMDLNNPNLLDHYEYCIKRSFPKQIKIKKL